MYRHLTWGATPTGRPPGPGRDHRRRWPRARRRSRRWRPAPPSGRAWVGRVGGVGKGWAWGGQIRGIGASGPPGRPRRSLPPAVLCAARRLLPSAWRSQEPGTPAPVGARAARCVTAEPALSTCGHTDCPRPCLWRRRLYAYIYTYIQVITSGILLRSLAWHRCGGEPQHPQQRRWPRRGGLCLGLCLGPGRSDRSSRVRSATRSQPCPSPGGRGWRAAALR